MSADDLVDALMVLVNAAYFKGTWQYFFDAAATTPREFYVTPGDSVMTPMMKQAASLRYGKDSDGSVNSLVNEYIRWREYVPIDKCIDMFVSPLIQLLQSTACFLPCFIFHLQC